MQRKSANGRSNKQKSRGGKPLSRRYYFRPAVEQLEDRRLLSLSNLMVSTFDDTAGSSVLSFNEASKLRLTSGALTGDHNLGHAQGLAVAPDGTFYVSSLNTGQVLHFSAAGNFLDVLGANDANPVQLGTPGTLAFGPNGNLYVADLGADLGNGNFAPPAIYQFNVNSAHQQNIASATLYLDYSPGGFALSPDGHDLYVGDLLGNRVLKYHDNDAPTVLIGPGGVAPPSGGINPSAIVIKANGALLIADLSLIPGDNSHHQILIYQANGGNPTLTQFINLTAPTGPAPQPTSLLIDTDGNLLVGSSPDHAGNGTIQKFDINTGALLDTIATGLGTPSGLALAPVAPADIVFSTTDSSRSDSVLRYNDLTQQPIPGGVLTGIEGMTAATGIATAPDGTYFVSSSHLLQGGSGGPGQILHFSNTGSFLGILVREMRTRLRRYIFQEPWSSVRTETCMSPIWRRRLSINSTRPMSVSSFSRTLPCS